jgi:hypothetical protein
MTGMSLSTLLWLGLLVLLGVMFVITLRRMSALVRRARDLERYQAAVDALDRRFAGVSLPLIQNLDEARRHAGDSVALQAQVAGAGTVLAELAIEARSLRPAPALTAASTALVAELERATRAVSLLEHGVNAMAPGTRGRDLEAQTSLKRGALNLRHAQGAFARIAHEVATLRPADLVAPDGVQVAATTALATYQAPDTEELEGRFEPRM